MTKQRFDFVIFHDNTNLSVIVYNAYKFGYIYMILIVVNKDYTFFERRKMIIPVSYVSPIR